ADERGWGLVGPPEITFTADASLKRGAITCVATLVQGPDEPAPSSAPSAPAMLLIRENGAERQVPIAKEVVTIGRMSDCDVVLKDKGASRRHVQLRTNEGVTTLTDLGSTNGTRLNGQTVQSGALSDGDRITIGTTVLEYRRT
ncbi:MAG TPA: FHA domain-containing protein, partial [Actinomycetota bacterium]|nr:FHA domain-containing protein [Actinomycetota bacterium]